MSRSSDAARFLDDDRYSGPLLPAITLLSLDEMVRRIEVARDGVPHMPARCPACGAWLEILARSVS